MKHILTAAAFSLLTTAAFAQATMEMKGTNSQGSSIGVQSSQVKGNGDFVGGNGTGTGDFGAGDQTSFAGERSSLVHAEQSKAGENGGTHSNNGHQNGR